MIKILFNILFFFNLSFTFSQTTINNFKNESDTIKLIITLSSFHNAKAEDARAISTILAMHIKEAYKLNKTFQVETPFSLSEIERIAAEDFDYMILTTDEYFNLQNKLPLEPLVTNMTNGHAGYKLHLIVNKSSNINDLSQLKNTAINILSPGNQQTAVLWIDKLLKERGLPNHNKFFRETVKDSKATNVLLPVYFKKADACIITDASLKLMSELNPSINNGIKILYSSDYLILGLGCLNKKKKNGDNYKILKEIIPGLYQNEFGKQLLNLFNAENLAPFKEEYLKAYNNLLK